MSIQLRTCGTPDIKEWDGRASYKQRHRDQGLCLNCSSPADPGYTLCAKHRSKQLAYDRIRVARVGYCRICHQKLGKEDKGRVTHYRGNCCPSRRAGE